MEVQTAAHSSDLSQPLIAALIPLVDGDPSPTALISGRGETMFEVADERQAMRPSRCAMPVVIDTESTMTPDLKWS